MKRLGLARFRACAAALCCLLPALAWPAMPVSLDEDLKILERGETLPLHIPGAKYRIATFPYEDPDGTQLGDALAAIVSREILVRASGISIGVLAYEGGLAPTGKASLSYFDKVEKVATAQNVTLSIWGMVRRSAASLRVETYLQLPPRLIEKNLYWRFALPQSMRGPLVAHLRPDRILLQSVELPGVAAEALRATAKRLAELHAEPRDDSPISAELPKRTVHTIVKRSGDWVFMNAGPKAQGWVRSAGYCIAQCAPILDTAKFTASLLGYLAGTESNLFSGQLTTDAQVLQLQIANYRDIENLRINYSTSSSHFDSPIAEKIREAGASGIAPAGGAALANAMAIDRVIKLLYQQTFEESRAAHEPAKRVYDMLKPDPGAIRAIAFDLADASQLDPGNLDVLQNLAVLFGYAGDERRASLARSLLEKMSGGL